MGVPGGPACGLLGTGHLHSRGGAWHLCREWLHLGHHLPVPEEGVRSSLQPPTSLRPLMPCPCPSGMLYLLKELQQGQEYS